MNAKTRYLKAMLTLLNDYRFDDITVAMLSAQADMSRASFYRYFQDKYELLGMCYMHFLNPVVYEKMKKGDIYGAALEKYNSIYQNKKVILNMFKSSGQNCLKEQIRIENQKMLSDGYKDIIGRDVLSDRESMIVEATVAASNCILLRWVQDGLTMTADEIVDITIACLPDSIKKINQAWKEKHCPELLSVPASTDK